MNVFPRWWKFNLVGAMGMVLQLSTLAFLDRCSRGRYLFASTAAVELALLHNFLWHMRFTWRERCDRSAWLGPLLRFQLSNGLVSLLGNLALMPLLIRAAHLPLLVANLIAILCCSLLNFGLGETWAFA